MWKKLTGNEIQKIELNILNVFDKFCRENNITYTLAYGTLLGAVRHQGVIPWDDDIDVCILRPDYEKFKMLVKKKGLPKPYQLLCEKDTGYLYPFCKIIDTRTSIIEKGVKNQKLNGIWVDIFPLDMLPQNKKRRMQLLCLCKFWVKMHYFSKSNKLFIGNSFFRKTVKFPLVLLSKVMGTEKCTKKLISLCEKQKNLNTEYCGSISWGAPFGILKREEYTDVFEITFEDSTFMAISCWDKYLKMAYGNYMKLPNEDERKGHPIDAWIMIEEEINESIADKK